MGRNVYSATIRLGAAGSISLRLGCDLKKLRGDERELVRTLAVIIARYQPEALVDFFAGEPEREEEPVAATPLHP